MKVRKEINEFHVIFTETNIKRLQTIFLEFSDCFTSEVWKKERSFIKKFNKIMKEQI